MDGFKAEGDMVYLLIKGLIFCLVFAKSVKSLERLIPFMRLKLDSAGRMKKGFRLSHCNLKSFLLA